MADAKALVAVLDVEEDLGALHAALDGIISHLEPLLELRNAGQLSVDTLRPVARVHGPVVTALVKSIGGRLSPNQNYSQEQLLVFGEAASLALNSVDILRPVLKASGHELDVQRYNFVRKLAAYGLHEHAMAQGKMLLASASASPGTAAGPGELHIAAVANVLVCYAELVKQGSSRAEVLWKDIYGPLDELLQLARDAADAVEAAKRLDVVLKCLGKVAETWQYASVVCNLTPIAVAQQLSALTACAAICRQEQVVQQVLADDAATAPDTVKLTMMNSLVYLLATDGSLPAPLLPLLHHLVVSLVQKRAGPLHPPTSGSCSGHPLAALLHATLNLQHCSLVGSPDEQLCALLQVVASAAKDLAAGHGELSQHEQRLRWCCLDGLRVSVAGILTQLLSAPQCAGGLLCSLSTCMELLCDASLRMINGGDASDAEVAAPSGTSAVTIAVRIQVTHALCTGQLTALRDDVSRSLGLLKGMLDSARERATPGAAGVIGPAVLHSLSASLGNAGLDLLQAQHASPAAVLLQAAAELAIERARLMRKQGEHGPDTDVSQLIKKCKSHVTALQQLPAHDLAMSAAASYVAQLHSLTDDKAHLLWSISKQFVQSSLAAYYAAGATAVAAAPQASAASGEGSAAVPAAPCKANRRGGRLQRMQTNTQSAEVSSKCTAKHSTAQDAGRPALMSAAAPAPRTLVQLLAAAALEKRGWPALLDSLDMYAVQELEVVREEAKRREDDGLQSLYCATVLDTLSKCAKVAESSDTQRARELLVKAVTFSSTLDTQISDLRASCELLDTLVAELQDAGHAQGSSVLGIMDSAATAHAHLGLCLAQKQLNGRGCADQENPAGHISQALSLWQRLLAAHGGSGLAFTFRMPQVTLHAALQLQQYVHLHAGALSEAADFSLDVVWRLVRELSTQVKVREQQAYLLSVTMPFTTCTAWVLASQPLVPLAEALTDAHQHRKLAEISKITEPVRDVYTTSAADHIAVATAAGGCATELERSGFLRHGPAPMLLRSQCHQIAAAAYLRAGDTASAYVQAQEALRITCGLMVTLECPPLSLSGIATGNNAVQSASGAAQDPDLTPAEAAAAAVKSGVATSALDYATDTLVQGDVADVTGYGGDAPTGNHSDEASAPKRKSGRVLSACLAWATAAAHLASLHSAARVFEAAGCVEDATCLWEECLRAAELFVVPGVQLLCRTYLAELSCRRGDLEAAAKHLKAADAVVPAYSDSRASAGGMFSVETPLLKAHTCAVHARLALLRQQHQQVQDTAQEGISACNAALESGRMGRSGRDGQGGTDGLERHGALVWHGICLRSHLQRLHAEALLQLGHRQEAGGLLQSALAQLQLAAAACPHRSAADIWPVDYGLTLAHLASAMAPRASPSSRSAATLVGLNSVTSVPCGGKSTAAQSCTRATLDRTDMSATSDQSTKKGSKAKACRSSPCKIYPQYPQRQGVHTDAASTDSVDLVSVMPALLQSLRLCWQLPLAAVYACRQLLHASIKLGLPYAAMMFLHLGHGMSYARQQALQREWRQNAASQHSGTYAEQATEDPADGGEGGCSLPQHRSAMAAGVHEAALAILMGLELEGDASSTEPLASLESGAKAWLLRALDVLAPDAVVSAIVQDDKGHGLLVGRVARGGAPLLVVLHGLDVYAAGQQPERAAGPSVGDVLDRCTARLRQLLNESGDSMHIDQDAASSQSHKAKWWKTRVSLDNSVKGLLQDLDQQCLGPWRCLMMPIPTAHLSVWREAADAFIGEHLSSALAEHPCSRVHSRMAVLRELFTVALSGMRYLQPGDPAALLDLVCSQLGLAAGRASTLAVELAAAEAAARVQVLKLQSRGTEPAASRDLPNADASPGRGQASRCIAPAGPRAGSARTTFGGSARARPGVASNSVSGSTAASRTGLREVTRRTGAAPSGGAPEPMDTENMAPQPAAAGDARTRRTTRAAATQSEASSNQAAAPKVATRAASTRLGTRSRTGMPAVAEDQPAENRKPDAPRGAPSEPATHEACVSGRSDPVAGAGVQVQQDKGPVLLVLSPALHALPWESMPCFLGSEVYRILSLPAACTTAGQPSVPSAADASSESSDAGGKAAGGCGLGLPARPSAFYVLNPNGDLMDTQRCFQPILEAQTLWEGIIGLRPSAEVLLAALQTRDLFLYFGHGSGEQFLPLPALRKLQRCATCLLMGCSSGRFRLHGAYDPSGAAVAYLLAGCPALVANLWDVTDRDIDRYCQALIHAWLGCDMPAAAGDRSSCAAGTKSELPSSSRPGSESLGLAVARSRVACKLTHLIGAAPVCYGLPQRREVS